MTYTPNTWKKGDVISSAKLNNIETGIQKISETTEEINTAVKTLTTSVEEVTKSVGTLTATTDELNTTVTDTNTNVADIKTSIAAIKSAINGITGSITDIPSRLADLEDTVRTLQKTNIVEVTDPTAQFSNASADVVIGDETITAGKAAGITAKTIALKGTLAESASISLKAVGSVTMNDVITTGDLAKSISNAAWSVNTDDEVVIRDCTFDQSGYNSIEIGLSSTAPKSVLIENCQFGDLNNNAITIFATKANATITIRDCEFGNISQMLRLSNRTNVSGVKVNIVNCTVAKCDEANKGRFLLGQDYTATTADAAASDNRFGKDKLTITLNNVTVDGKLVTSSEGIFEVYRDATNADVAETETNAFPTFIVQ